MLTVSVCILLFRDFLDPALAALALTYVLQMTSLFQWGFRTVRTALRREKGGLRLRRKKGGLRLRRKKGGLPYRTHLTLFAKELCTLVAAPRSSLPVVAAPCLPPLCSLR